MDDLDADALRATLSASLDAPVTDLHVRHDGLNRIVVVSTADDAYVLRNPRKFREQPYMNSLADEYAVVATLADSPVPTAEPVLYREEAPGIEGPFYLMEHLDGEVVDLGSDLPERFRRADARGRIAVGLVDALATVHRLPVDDYEDACLRFTPREHVAEASERIDAVAGATGYDAAALRAVGDRLADEVPAESRRTLVHGDYRPGNVLVAGDDDPHVSGVLDWETATVGDPLTDLGYLLLRWRDDDDPAVPLDDVAAEHDEAVRDDLREANATGLSPFTGKPGSPGRRALVDRYEAATGYAFDHEQFHVALAAYLLASVWLDIHQTRLDAGEESDLPAHVDYVAGLATLELDGHWTV